MEKKWNDYIILDRDGQLEYINDAARDMLGIVRKDALNTSFRQFLLRYAFNPISLKLKPLAEEVAVFTGDQCAFVATECLQVRQMGIYMGEILVLRNQVQYYQDEPALHATISANMHAPVSSARLGVDRLVIDSDCSDQGIFKEPVRLNAAGMMCFRRMVNRLMSMRSVDRFHQLMVWPTAPKSLVDWTLKTMGWVSHSPVIKMADTENPGAFDSRLPGANEWTLLHLSFSTTRIDALEQISFSELTDYERLWLIPR